MLRAIFLLGVLFAVSSACTCKPDYDPKERFCASAFVGRFLFLKEIKSNESLHTSFYALPHSVFKSTDGSPQPFQPTIIFTSTQSAACGVVGLKEGADYLLNGSINDDGQLWINSCGRIAPIEWKKVPAEIKKALQDGSYFPCPTPTSH